MRSRAARAIRRRRGFRPPLSGVRVSCPPIISPCFYGIDTPTREELIASSKTVEETRTYLTADSLGYLSPEGLLKASPKVGGGYCTACFTEDYPVNVVFKKPSQSGLF